MVNAENYALTSMRQINCLPATLFGLGDAGPFMFMPQSLADEQAKDAFAFVARLVCVAYNATATVLAMECWAKFRQPDEPFDPGERPSEAIDRREIVLLSGETRGGSQLKVLPIIRTDAGGFFGLGDSIPLPPANTAGRFSPLLSPIAPNARERRWAWTLLEGRGIRLPPPPR